MRKFKEPLFGRIIIIFYIIHVAFMCGPQAVKPRGATISRCRTFSRSSTPGWRATPWEKANFSRPTLAWTSLSPCRPTSTRIDKRSSWSRKWREIRTLMWKTIGRYDDHLSRTRMYCNYTVLRTIKPFCVHTCCANTTPRWATTTTRTRVTIVFI